MSKVLEKAVIWNLEGIAIQNNVDLHGPDQFGFKPGSSTT